MSGSEDDTVRLWDIATGTLLQIFDGASNSVSSVASAPNGKTERTLLIQNDWIMEGKQKLLFLPLEYRPSSMAVRNMTIAIGRESGRVSIIGLKEGIKHV